MTDWRVLALNAPAIFNHRKNEAGPFGPAIDFDCVQKQDDNITSMRPNTKLLSSIG